MAAAAPRPRAVHLVGSVPLGSAREVFETASAILGPLARRIPDGETGERTNWIRWQATVLARMPFLQPDAPVSYAATDAGSRGASHVDTPNDSAVPQFSLKPGFPSAAVRFGPLGYADAAIASYSEFARLKAAGKVAKSCRFQVSLPTPLAIVAQYVAPRSQTAVEPAYERALLAELARILQAIPPGELAIQWDIAIEIAVIEGLRTVLFSPVRDGIVERIARLCDAMPAAVETGLHLCYGDSGHKHFVEPKDLAALVDLVNALEGKLKRDLGWVHMPVPRERSDSAYFAPLKALRLKPTTQLFLGLVHLTDGEAGLKRRVAAAETAIKGFGLATECGFGRRPPDTIPTLLRLHTLAV